MEKVKRANHEEMNKQGRKKGGKWVPRPTQGTFTMYMTGCDLENSVVFIKVVEITSHRKPRALYGSCVNT